MIDVINLSNLKIAFNTQTEDFIIFDKNDVDIESDIPIFSADGLTSQENFLIKEYINSYELRKTLNKALDYANERCAKINEEKENLVNKLLSAVSDLNDELKKLKNENEALKTELSVLRQSKLEESRIEVEGECP